VIAACLPDHRCARGCRRLVYFEGDVCTANVSGQCYPLPTTEPQIRAEMKRIKALAASRPSPCLAEADANFRAWMQRGSR
jgi:hypothetical protein